MEKSRLPTIQTLAGDGNIEELKKILGSNYTQTELNDAFEMSIAYSQIQIAEYLLTLGAEFSYNDYEGVYYAAHNNKLEGLKFSISNGVDINVNDGMLLKTSIQTATNTKEIKIVEWLLDNGANPKHLTKSLLQVVNNYGTDELKKLITNARKSSLQNSRRTWWRKLFGK
jgi:uncharacterized protein